MWQAILQFLQQAGQGAQAAGTSLGNAQPALGSILDLGGIWGMMKPQAGPMEPINRNSQTGQPTPFQLPAAQSAASAGNSQQLMQLIQNLLRK